MVFMPKSLCLVVCGFQEVMAIFCLSNNLEDLENKIANITIAYSKEKKPIYAKDLKAQGPMTV